MVGAAGFFIGNRVLKRKTAKIKVAIQISNQI
jgi:hypothetical protein